MSGMPTWAYFAAIIPALLVTVLMYLGKLYQPVATVFQGVSNGRKEREN